MALIKQLIRSGINISNINQFRIKMEKKENADSSSDEDVWPGERLPINIEIFAIDKVLVKIETLFFCLYGPASIYFSAQVCQLKCSKIG